jgi:hypothetical protein
MKWAEKRNLDRMSKTDFDSFIKENNVNLENRDSKKYHQEINRKLGRKKTA